MAVAKARPAREVGFRRYGLGWQYRPPEAPVVLTFSQVSDRRGELRAEVHVTNLDGGHVLRRYVDLLAGGPRGSASTLASDLDRETGDGRYPWRKILEAAGESIIRAVRQGPTPEVIQGDIARPPGVRWLCDGLVIEGKPNGWTAAGSTGKSTFAAGLALAHALGMPFLGRETTKGTPLYLDWESDAEDLTEKLWLMSRWYGERWIPPVHRMPMRGPAAANAAAIANRIEQVGATLVLWDGVQAACGPLGQSGNYEALALELETLIALLPPTTHVLLDHVTGDELKAGAVPLKGRGATRKVEFLRNHWTLSLDRDAQREKRHVVGWTHTKVNRTQLFEPFGVEVIHAPDELGFKVLTEAEVEPLRERMPQHRQLAAAMAGIGRPCTYREAAEAWQSKADPKTLDLVRALVNRHAGRLFVKLDNGLVWTSDGARRASAGGNPEPGRPEHLPFDAPEYDDDRDSEVPF